MAEQTPGEFTLVVGGEKAWLSSLPFALRVFVQHSLATPQSCTYCSVYVWMQLRGTSLT